MAPLVVQAETCLVQMPSPLHGPSGGAGCDRGAALHAE